MTLPSVLRFDLTRRTVIALLSAFPALILPLHALAQSFDKVNETVDNVVDILIVISVGVVTAAIMWAGYKMIFGGARLADVANVLFGGTLVGGAGAFAAYIIA